MLNPFKALARKLPNEAATTETVGPGGAGAQGAGTFKDLLPTLLTMAFLLLFGVIFYKQYYEATQRKALSSTTSSVLKLVDEMTRAKRQVVSIREPLESVLVEHAEHAFLSELFLHLAVALIVAFVVIGSVEISAGIRRKREATKERKDLLLSVWSALFERFVPAKVVREIESIARLDFVKERCHYTITFMPPYPGMPQDAVVMKRELRYTIRNLRNNAITFPLKSKISSAGEDCQATDYEGRAITLPRHVRLAIGGKPVKIADVVKPNERGQLRNLSHTVPIHHDEAPVDVDICSEEIVQTSGYNSYLQLSAVSEITVEIHNHCPQSLRVLEVQFNHPNYANFKQRGEWVFEYAGGMLPGQSFHVCWGQVPPPGATVALLSPPIALVTEAAPETQRGESAEAAPLAVT